MITLGELQRAAKGKLNTANAQSVLTSFSNYAAKFGLTKPHRYVHYFSQLMHESGEFRYDKEIWGPTAAQSRYDTRTDLGNTKAKDGDGKRYMGRGPIQITGKSNYQQFTDWCRKAIDSNAPDFVKEPEKINTDPWEGLVALWYWSTRELNKYADRGDIEQITKRINGGLNGFDDRIELYARLALVVLDRPVNSLKDFQIENDLIPDGDPGPKTRAALHAALVELTPGEMAKPTVTVAPVTEKVETKVEVDKPVPVTPKSMEVPWWRSKEFITPVLGTGGVGAMTGFFEKFGSIPLGHLAFLMVFATAAIVGVLLYLKHRDKRDVEKEVKRLE